MRLGFSILALAAFSSCSLAAGHKVLIFSIDGCRPDALQKADIPNVQSLIDRGAVSYTAESSHTATHSGPNYSSMLTGVDVPKHGVTTNEFTGNHFDQWPSLFTRLEAWKPSLYTASLVQWGPINTGPMQIATTADYAFSGADASVAANAANLLATANPDVMFVELEGVDTEGHSSGFSATNPKYISAIHQADGNVGAVLNALYARPSYASEDWLILTTTDHGGKGTVHEPSGGAETWTTFYIAAGSTVKIGADLGSPDVYDIAVTALDYMGYATAGLNLDGRVVGPAVTVPEPGVAEVVIVIAVLLTRPRRHRLSVTQ